MTGTKFHCSGRNGEEPPLTPAQRRNKAVWEHDVKSRRRAALSLCASGTIGVIAILFVILWRLFNG